MVRAGIEPLRHEDASQEITSALGRLCGGFAGASNLLRVAAHSPAVLDLLEAANQASDRMALPKRSRAGIALRIAELNGCRYCLALHTDAAMRAGMDETLVRRYRMGVCDDPKEQALLALAGKTLLGRGRYTGLAIEAARQLGANEGEIVEVLALVGLHTLLNYLNLVADTALDFPAVDDLGLPRPLGSPCDPAQPVRLLHLPVDPTGGGRGGEGPASVHPTPAGIHPTTEGTGP